MSSNGELPIANMRPDPPDLRDRVYSPTLRPLQAAVNARPFESPEWIARVRHQGSTSACTGFSLAALVDLLFQQAYPGAPFEPTSCFMLYYLARKYDELPGDDPSVGSTARGGMKAWHKHGACRLHFWDSIEHDPTSADPAWQADAFRTPLGAYYRVDHTEIGDLHAAIAETGAVYVTAMIHDGWYSPDSETGTVPFSSSSREVGGHAFLLVGYDEHGFWIQNSWGEDWAQKGFARLSYGDWRAHSWDAWVGQIGVHVSFLAASLGQGLQSERLGEAGVDAVDASRQLLSSNPELSAQQITPYIVNLENNGRLSDRGQFFTRPADLVALVHRYLPAALQDWKLGENDPIDIGVYAHGGLTPEADAEVTAKRWIPALYSRQIFPVFLMWETGLRDTLKNVWRDVLEGVPESAAAATFGDWLLDRLDERLERALAGCKFVWDEMKENARLASERARAGDQGGIRLLWEQLATLPEQQRGRLRFHLIGHSAGAEFHAHLLPKLLEAGLTVDGLYFLAPALRLDLFREKILPAYRSGKVASYTQFHLADAVERRDDLTLLNLPLYHKSLLYLVSNAFERPVGAPLLGLEKCLPGDLLRAPAGTASWDWIATPNPSPEDPLRRSLTTTHGGFDDDDDTLRSVVERIAARRAAGRAAPAGTGRRPAGRDGRPATPAAAGRSAGRRSPAGAAPASGASGRRRTARRPRAPKQD
jgi:hypothetical protein